MQHSDRPTRDTLWFASLLSGAYGSAAIALLFLALDATRGDPFATPSLVGSALLFGADPSRALPVRLDAVALYSVVHLLVFVAVGTVVTRMTARRWLPVDRPLALTGVVFLTLTGGALAAGTLLAPGLVDAIRIAPLLVGNAGASIVMAGLIRSALRPRSEARVARGPILSDAAR